MGVLGIGLIRPRALPGAVGIIVGLVDREQLPRRLVQAPDTVRIIDITPTGREVVNHERASAGRRQSGGGDHVRGVGLDEVRLDRAGGAGDKHQWRRRTKVRRALAPVAKQITRHRSGAQAHICPERINACASHHARPGRDCLRCNGKRREAKTSRQHTIREEWRGVPGADRTEE